MAEPTPNPPKYRTVFLLEGPDLAGKTSVFRILQNLLPLHNAIKLSAAPREHMSLAYMNRVYQAAETLVAAAAHNHFIFDRYTTSERVYGSLYRSKNGLYVPEDYEHLAPFERTMAAMGAVHILLILDTEAARHRLEAKKAESPHEDHGSVTDVMRVQDRYLEVCGSGTTGFTNQMVVDTSQLSPFGVARSILHRVGFEVPHAESIHQNQPYPDT